MPARRSPADPSARLDHEQRALVDLLHKGGPMTAAQIAEGLYPNGDEFAESWDLSAVAKVEMELGRCGFAVERLDWSDGVELWAATSAARAAELERTARREAALQLRALRAKRAAGTWTVQEKFDLAGHLERLRLRREGRRFAMLPPDEQVRRFNLEMEERSAQMRASLDDLRRAMEAPAGPSGLRKAGEQPGRPHGAT